MIVWNHITLQSARQRFHQDVVDVRTMLCYREKCSWKYCDNTFRTDYPASWRLINTTTTPIYTIELLNLLHIESTKREDLRQKGDNTAPIIGNTDNEASDETNKWTTENVPTNNDKEDQLFGVSLPSCSANQSLGIRYARLCLVLGEMKKMYEWRNIMMLT